jgi:hypothetical protein
MDETDTQPKGSNPRARRWIASAALLAGGVLAGGILAGSQAANAQTATPTASSTATANASGDSAVSPADLRHGPGETLLTGTTADKVKAAALDAVPGGTVIRVETDSEGSPYEAHIQKPDGSFVTVKIDENFNVTDTISGFGAGPMQPGTSN